MMNVHTLLMLVDKRIFIGGLAMLIVGMVLSIGIASTMPIGQQGMTEEEELDLVLAQQENEDYTTLAGILVGIGFLLILISFGTRRRKGKTKRVEKKPAE